MKRPKIRLTLVEQKGAPKCHHGHKPGDVFDFDTDRGKLCPMALHSGFPFIDILRYGGTVPGGSDDNSCFFCCPDPAVIQVFKVERLPAEPVSFPK